MIFAKPIIQVTFEDVVGFANSGIKEGINLDYKRDFTSDHLNRTIASFANTHGGTIIVGLDDEDGKPKLPAMGMDFQEGLHERVVQICVHSISPPVTVNVRVCDPVEGKTFVIIQVPESVATPHAINGGEDVYIRTDNISKLEKRADVQRIEWLLSERNKSVELRRMTIEAAEHHYRSLLWPPHITVARQEGIRGELRVTVAPVYPYESMAIPETFMDKLPTLRGRNGQFEMPYALGQLEPVQDGVCLFHRNNGMKYHLYQEFNKFGTITNYEKIAMEKTNRESGGEVTTLTIYESMLLDHLDAILKAAYNIYSKYGYWGNVRVEIAIDNIIGTEYCSCGMFNREHKVDMNFSHLAYVYTVSELEGGDSLKNALVEQLTEIAWSFRKQININAVNSKLKELGYAIST